MEDSSVKIGYIQISQLRLSEFGCFHLVFGGVCFKGVHCSVGCVRSKFCC